MSQQNRGLLPGTVDLVILRTLSEGPQHGFAVSRRIQARSDGMLALQDAALYQALHRMEKGGLVKAEWGVSEKGRRAKFYRLTAEGARQAAREESFWRRYAAAVFKVLDAVPQRG